MASATGATVKAIPITDEGVVDLEAAANMMNERTRMLAFAHISNVLGTINPAKELVSLAKAQNIPVLVDGAQALSDLDAQQQLQITGFLSWAVSSHEAAGHRRLQQGTQLLGSVWRLQRKAPREHGGVRFKGFRLPDLLHNKHECGADEKEAAPRRCKKTARG